MKVIGLLSGGKGSIYNLMRCKKEGHEIVCLAHMCPPPTYPMYSPMYQTVTSEGTLLMAETMSLPLFRKEIRGRPINTETNSYEVHPNDEVEDLYQLLFIAKEQYPELEAVSYGGINNQYQRTRIDHVCARLQLTPLCYLWKRNQMQLFDSMIQDGVDAFIVKVCHACFTTKHLGMTLKEAREHLIEMNQVHGVRVCGEGDQYDTFVVDSPLFRKRINMDKIEAVLKDPESDEPGNYLQINQITLIPKIE